MMAEATDGQEAAAAVVSSRKRLAAVLAREPRVRRSHDQLARHLEVNHFSDRLDEVFGRPGEDQEGKR